MTRRWLPLAIAFIGVYLAMRGQFWPAIGLGMVALALWRWPSPVEARGRAQRPQPSRPDASEMQARAVLGVGPTATAAEIRAAFRTKMAQAHPDRGGSNHEAARLVAARDRLLKRK